MAIKEVILIIATILNLIVGLFVYLRNRKSKINISYSLLSLGLAGWAFTNAIFQITPSLENALFWAKLSDISTILLVSSLFYFSLIFPKSILISQKYQYYLLYFFTFLVTIISLPNFNFVRKEVIFQNHIQKQIITESGFYIFAFYILLFLIWAVINLKEKYKISKRDIKFQLQYVFTGIAIGIFCGTTFNLILPLMGNYSLVWLGPISILISLVFIALAILRYHLFEIRVILTELLVGVMGVILLVLPFLMTTPTLRILTISVFLLFCLFGYILIKATHQEIKRREEIEKLYQELKVLDKAKSEFISMASHQLRTPLTAIKGYISMMLEGSYNHFSPRAKEKLKNVLYSNERLIKIVNNLLNISKIELGKMELEKEPVQIEDLIQSCYEELKIEAEKKNLKFHFQKPKKPLPKISIDSLKIRQVILNLIDNAIRYTQKGEIEIKAKKINSRIQVSVRDTGEGLTQEEKKKIFEGFTRGAAGFTYWIEGAGLGLYIGKKYVELHQGKIWAESKGKGEGSIFLVELPIE